MSQTQGHLPTLETCSGVAGVIVLGGEVGERPRHSRGSTPPPNFYTDLDFWNGLEHNWGAVAPLPPALNYATGDMGFSLELTVSQMPRGDDYD